jgi:hypothetical protein
MAEFGPKLIQSLEKSGILGIDAQLDYLWQKMNPSLTQAVVINRPKDIREAIGVAIDLEYAMNPGKIPSYTPTYIQTTSVGYNEVTPIEGIQSTNAQMQA